MAPQPELGIRSEQRSRTPRSGSRRARRDGTPLATELEGSADSHGRQRGRRIDEARATESSDHARYSSKSTQSRDIARRRCSPRRAARLLFTSSGEPVARGRAPAPSAHRRSRRGTVDRGRSRPWAVARSDTSRPQSKSRLSWPNRARSGPSSIFVSRATEERACSTPFGADGGLSGSDALLVSACSLHDRDMKRPSSHARRANLRLHANVKLGRATTIRVASPASRRRR